MILSIVKFVINVILINRVSIPTSGICTETSNFPGMFHLASIFLVKGLIFKLLQIFVREGFVKFISRLFDFVFPRLIVKRVFHTNL